MRSRITIQVNHVLTRLPLGDVDAGFHVNKLRYWSLSCLCRYQDLHSTLLFFYGSRILNDLKKRNSLERESLVGYEIIPSGVLVSMPNKQPSRLDLLYT